MDRLFCEPKAGFRHVEVTERRTAVDFAQQMRWLVDEAYPHTETMRLELEHERNQAGAVIAEPRMDSDDVARVVLYMAELPLEANVQFMTIMATAMPYIGRG